MPNTTERRSRAQIGASQRAYLRDTMAELKITASRLAQMLGMAPSTFTRFMKEREGSEKTLHAATMDKVERLRQVNSSESFPTTGQAQWQTLREEASQFVFDDQDEVSKAVKSLINGRPGIDPWTLRTRSLELEGFMPGDVVLVDLNATPQPGDAVCAQVYDRGHTTANTVMRQYQPTGPVNLLVPRSLDPLVQQPLVVDNDRVLIRGVLLPHRFRTKKAA